MLAFAVIDVAAEDDAAVIATIVAVPLAVAVASAGVAATAAVEFEPAAAAAAVATSPIAGCPSRSDSSILG